MLKKRMGGVGDGETQGETDAGAPAGVRIVPEFVSEEEEAELVRGIDAGEWTGDGKPPNPQLRRRLQQYGALMMMQTRVLHRTDAAVPSFVQDLSDRIVARFPELDLGLPRDSGGAEDAEKQSTLQRFNYVVFNEYRRGQGIAAHADAPAFGPVICSLSMLSDCLIKFTKITDPEGPEYSMVLPRRSLMIMQGESRYDWKHCITKDETEVVPDGSGAIIERDRRVSIVFRTISEHSFTTGQFYPSGNGIR